MEQFKAKVLGNSGVVLLALFLLLSWFGLYYDGTDLLVVAPNYSISAEELIEVADYPVRENHLYVLTVYQGVATPFLCLYAQINPMLDLAKMESIPFSLEEYYQLSRWWLEESKIVAQFVALSSAGFQPQITSQGVLVGGVAEYSGAYGVLQQGDIIHAVNGEPVAFVDEFTDTIIQMEIGSTVQLDVMRQDKELALAVQLGGTEAPVVGIWPLYNQLSLESPVEIEIDTGHYIQGGPSGGLMFALAIYNRITDGDITNGHRIAGTGEIRLDGTVGAIGGIKQKVLAAEAEGAEILFCPAENYQEAIAYATNIQVVKVGHFQDVIHYLSATRDGSLSHSCRTEKIKLLAVFPNSPTN